MTRPPTPRVRPGTLREVGPIAWLLAHGGGRRYGTQPIALFLVLGRQRRLFAGWLRFAGALMPRGTLPRRQTELVILRVAGLSGSDYEIGHHRRIAARCGVTPAETERVLGDAGAADWSRWSTRDRALLNAVDELVRSHDLTEQTWRSLGAELSEPQLVEFCLLVGHYRMLADAITVLRLRPEALR